jgi:hypothetical protein
MKNRLLSITLILVLSASFAIAQETSKMKFAIMGGVNYQNLNGKAYNGDELENEMLLGFHGGINVQIPIAPAFYFQPALRFATKGATESYTILTEEFTKEVNLNYIEMPLSLVYKASLGNGSFMLGFGPYVAYAVKGKVKTEGGGLSLSEDIVFQNGVSTNDNMLVPFYKAFDTGGNIFAGYEMANGIFVQLETQFGFININPEYTQLPDDKSTTRNTGFGVSLGYRF